MALPENPIDRLYLAADLVGMVDADLAQWLQGAIAEHVGSGTSMDRALGLAGSLGRSPRFEYLRRERDSHLAAALAHLGGDFCALASEASAFERRIWPAWRYRDAPDPAWPPVRRILHAAFRLGLRVPATVDGLRRALLPPE